MTKHSINIQDGFLFQSLKVAQPVALELITGRHLEGRLKRFDRFALDRVDLCPIVDETAQVADDPAGRAGT